MAKKEIYMPTPGYRSSPLQQLATKRNWDKLQIKGSSGQLRHQLMNSSMPGEVKSYWMAQLNAMEDVLNTTLDKKWNADKVAFEVATAKEAFGEPLPKIELPESLANTPVSDTAQKEEVVAKAKAKRAKIQEAAKDF